MRLVTDSWRTFVAGIVNSILGLLSYEVSLPEAVALFALASCLAVALSAQGNHTNKWTRRFRIGSWLVASLFGATYFVFVILQTISSDPRYEDQVLFYFFISLLLSAIFSAPIFHQSQPKHRPSFRRFGYGGFTLTFAVVIIAAMVSDDAVAHSAWDYPLVVLLSLTVTFMYFASDAVEISRRSFSIFVVIGSLWAINLASRIFEAHGLGIVG
ncbi:MAG: hypothetical protein AAGI88_02460 [Pseudomonadota bacterium]